MPFWDQLVVEKQGEHVTIAYSGRWIYGTSPTNPFQYRCVTNLPDTQLK